MNHTIEGVEMAGSRGLGWQRVIGGGTIDGEEMVGSEGLKW